MRILILCTGNSCRSQMAEAYLRHLSRGSNAVEVFSAGIEAHGLNPLAMQVLQEDGVDISGLFSKTIDHFLEGRTFDFDYLITVCDHAKESCPYLTGKHQLIHHSFPDPAKAVGTDAEKLLQFRSVRDQIKNYCQSFLETHKSLS